MELPLALGPLLICCAVICTASFVQGNVGFGMALLSTPILMIIDPSIGATPVILAAVPMSAGVTWRERKHCRADYVGWILLGSFPGSLAAALTLTLLRQNLNLLAIVLGALILLAVGISLWGLHPAIGRRSLFMAGLAGGFTGTTTAVGGPPLAIVLQTLDGASFRGTINLAFLFTGLIAIGNLALTRQIRQMDFMLALPFAASCVTGIALSNLTAGRIPAGTLRYLILGLAALAAIVLIVEHLVT